MTKSIVSVVKYEEPLKSVRKVIDLVDGFKNLPVNGKIFIKPNLVYWNKHCDFPKWGMLTTSIVVEEIIKYLKERGADDIAIGDGIIGDDTKDKETPKDAFEKLGYNILKERYGIKIYDMFERPYEKVELANGVSAKMNSDMLHADFLIDIPVLKTHAQCVVSLGIKNLKGLSPILAELSEKKYVSEPSFVKQKIRMILPDNQPFYINLADEPPRVDGITTCSICFNKDDEGIVKCPSCDTPAHKVCWAQWADSSSIGISHVFRCHNCFNILKLEKDYLHDVRAGKIPTIAELTKMKKRNIIEYLHEIESKSEPKVVQTEDPMAVEIRAMVETKKSQPKEQARRRKKPSVKICPNCSKIMMGDKKNCPSCGFVLF